MPYSSSLKLTGSHGSSHFSKKRFDQNIAQANYSFFVSQTNKKDYKRYDLFEQMSAKIFAELVEKIIVFKDKTVTLVLKIDKDLNSYFDEKSIDLSNFTLILPPKSLKFEESKRKIKISPMKKHRREIQ